MTINNSLGIGVVFKHNKIVGAYLQTVRRHIRSTLFALPNAKGIKYERAMYLPRSAYAILSGI